jgi:hypothetical protein
LHSFAQAKRQAEEEEKRKAGEAKAVREAAKKLLKKERQRLRAINEGGGETDYHSAFTSDVLRMLPKDLSMGPYPPSGGPDRLLDDDDLEKLTSKLEFEAMQSLCNSLSVFGITRWGWPYGMGGVDEWESPLQGANLTLGSSEIFRCI